MRDYGVEGQLGLEPTFKEYLDKLLHVFDEIKRVPKPSGTCWVNLGDTYASSPSGLTHEKAEEWGKKGDGLFNRLHNRHTSNKIAEVTPKPQSYGQIPSKCLVGVPERFMLGMIDRGWILRNKIIWHKPNCMPSSARDRFTVDFEPIFFFVKSKKYFFNMPREPHRSNGQYKPFNKRVRDIMAGRIASSQYKASKEEMLKWQKNEDSTHGEKAYNPFGRAGRTVWKITTQGFPEAHFATFPEELVKKPLLAGCPEFVCKKCNKPKEKISELEYAPAHSRGDNYKRVEGSTSLTSGAAWKDGGWNELPALKIVGEKILGWSDCGCNAGFDGGLVLDPFMGSGTVGVVARKHSRNFIGFELSKEYVEIANKRLKPFMEQAKLSEVT